MAIDVDSGLYLEGRGLRLKWCSSPEELRRLTRPDYCVEPPGTRGFLVLGWNDRVFGGLACQVMATFEASRPNLSGVRLVFQYPDGIHSEPAGFEWLGSYLAAHFGPPLFIQDDGEQGVGRWAIPGVSLRHEYFNGMGGGHYLFIFPNEADA